MNKTKNYAIGLLAILLTLGLLAVVVINRENKYRGWCASRSLALANSIIASGSFPNVRVRYSHRDDTPWGSLIDAGPPYVSTVRGTVSSEKDLEMLKLYVSSNSLDRFPVEVKVVVESNNAANGKAPTN